MEKFTVKNLRSFAKRNNIRGYSKLPKEALQTLLINRLPREVFREKLQEELMSSLEVCLTMTFQN